MVQYALTTCALDPGETTGIATRDGEGLHQAWTQKTPWETYDFLIHAKPDVVLCECFVYSGYANPHKTYTVKLVGGIEAICQMLDIRLVFQRPYERYPFLRDAEDFLIRRGDNYTQHEIDALAHIFLFEERSTCTKESLKPTSKLVRR